MSTLKTDITDFLKNKIFITILILVALGSYGFKLMHPAIGIDDTPYEYYFSEGLIVVVGRWVLFLLNKLLNNPMFFTIPYKGIFPCLRGGLLLRLLEHISSACISFRRVCLG